MANSPFDKERNYLHPLPGNPKFRTSDFQKMESGVTQDGTRIEAFTATNPAINRGYRQGVQISKPGAAPVLVFGTYQEINDISHQIKSDINGVGKSLRPLGSGQFFSLNAPAQGETHSMPDRDTVERYAAAKQMFPNHGRDNQVLSDEQIEKRALKEHMQEHIESKVQYPSSADGQQQIKEMTAPAQQGSTLVTDAPPSEGT